MRTATNCGKMTIIFELEEMNVVDLTVYLCLVYLNCSSSYYMLWAYSFQKMWRVENIPLEGAWS